MTTETDPSHPVRAFSGTVFVIACLIGAALFVTFLLAGAPLLRDRTLELAPPLAPQEVATGEIDGTGWSALAHEPRDDEPCLRVSFADGANHELCTGPRGPDIRALDAVTSPGSERAVFHGIVGPRVTSIRLVLDDGGPVGLRPSYVDFGFPMGFFATELEPGTVIRRVVVTDRDGEVRGEHDCSPGAAGPPGAGCAMNVLAP